MIWLYCDLLYLLLIGKEMGGFFKTFGFRVGRVIKDCPLPPRMEVHSRECQSIDSMDSPLGTSGLEFGHLLNQQRITGDPPRNLNTKQSLSAVVSVLETTSGL